LALGFDARSLLVRKPTPKARSGGWWTPAPTSPARAARARRLCARTPARPLIFLRSRTCA